MFDGKDSYVISKQNGKRQDAPTIEKPKSKILHSVTEKNRRQKMNKRLSDLSNCLVIGSAQRQKKFNKITILKMAVEHMKNSKASNSISNNNFFSQNYLNFEELQSLALDQQDEFLIVIKADSGKILYASDTCVTSIGYQPKELIDKVFFEIIHPHDTKIVKDQLYFSETNTNRSNHKYVISKFKTSGDRRSFMCRIKNNKSIFINDNQSDQFKVVRFVGYLDSKHESNLRYNTDLPYKSDSPLSQNHSCTFLEPSKTDHKMNGSTILHYLIAYGKVEDERLESKVTDFIAKLDSDGKILYSESCVFSLFGFLPNQLKNESIFSLIHSEDVADFKSSLQQAVSNPKERITTDTYRFSKANSEKEIVYLKSVLHAFKNPHSGQIEFITATNHLVKCPKDMSTNSTSIKQYNHYKNGLITSMPEENVNKMSLDEIMNNRLKSQSSKMNALNMFLRNDNFEMNNFQVPESVNNINFGYLNSSSQSILPFQDYQAKLFPNNFPIGANDKLNKLNLSNIYNFDYNPNKDQSTQIDDNSNYQINTLNLNLQNNTNGHNFESGPYSFY